MKWFLLNFYETWVGWNEYVWADLDDCEGVEKTSK